METIRKMWGNKLHLGGKLISIYKLQTYSCLRKKSAQQILDAQLWLLQNSTYFLGAPPIDEHFLTDYPENLYASKSIYPINTLIGTTTLEVEESS